MNQISLFNHVIDVFIKVYWPEIFGPIDYFVPISRVWDVKTVIPYYYGEYDFPPLTEISIPLVPKDMSYPTFYKWVRFDLAQVQ